MITYKTRIKQLRKQRISYIDFLKSNEGDNQDDWMLITEIEKIQKQIDLLEAKPIGQLLKECLTWELEKESELNFINLKPRDVRVIANK